MLILFKENRIILKNKRIKVILKENRIPKIWPKIVNASYDLTDLKT